ncbi:MAG TPA: HAD family phosphatase [Candidatus Angelobacter sp.]|nr:HAD family phosphatase [Candidatus Angelobacter sp.]
MVDQTHGAKERGMLAGVIFDFDGVIVDSHPLHLQAWKEFFCSVGKDVSDDELAFARDGAKREEILRRFLGDMTPQQIQEFGAEKDKLFQSHAGELKLVRGFAEFLAQLETANIAVAVASSGSRTRVENTLEKFALRERFCAVVAGDDVARGKPDPELFLLAARGMRIAAENILVCEDAVSGAVAARAAGMRCLAIAGNGTAAKFKEAGAGMVVEDFSQVKMNAVQQLFARAAPTATT